MEGGTRKMLLITILVIILLLLIATIVLVASTIGTIGVIVFGDVIVCVFVIVMIIRALIRKKRR